MARNNILVTGGSGTLGSYVRHVFFNDQVIAPRREEMDIRNIDAINKIFTVYQPNYVIHAAAETNVDICETDHTHADAVNIQGTKNVIDVCKKYGARLIYISTSSVFPGTNHIYTENDIPSPANYYGSTKLKGEDYVQKSGLEYMIVRIGWLIGGGMKEKKFISYILSSLKKGEKIYAVKDRYGSLAYAPLVLAFIQERIAERGWGVYHFGSSGSCSRYDMACAIRDIMKSSSEIVPVTHEYYAGQFTAHRPVYEVLGSTRIPIVLSWKDMLRTYVATELI